MCGVVEGVRTNGATLCAARMPQEAWNLLGLPRELRPGALQLLSDLRDAATDPRAGEMLIQIRALRDRFESDDGQPRAKQAA
jgi:hypothetical protein